MFQLVLLRKSFLSRKLGLNNVYFHRMVKVKRSRSSFKCLWDVNGVKVEDVAQIKNVVVEYYQKLFGNSTGGLDANLATRLEQLISPDLLDVQKVDIIKPVTADEIRKVIFSMSCNISPGPDGYSAGFFLKKLGCWLVMK